ncbi:MAG: carboxylating nicotinate-nucleotide diphosphorylase [Bacteroidia bacterium]|nr:carboxylating nicotinate-nucleotide diphosphorylase [Bacteroidia bacterium]
MLKLSFTSLEFIQSMDLWLAEDVGAGDFSSLGSIGADAIGTSQLILKENGVIAGLEWAEVFLNRVDSNIQFDLLSRDGDFLEKGSILATAEGNIRSLLKAERLMLNVLQRLSGVATQTRNLVEFVKDTGVTLLDTRKTTPGLRMLEKWAVSLGGAQNHRIGLYDMVMLKDNHVDSAGGITAAVEKTRKFLSEQKLDLKIEVETRNLDEVNEALVNKVDRIMFDNFSIDLCKEAVKLVDKRSETEASGGITRDSIRDYALTGVQFISVGALTHTVKSLDISFKTKIKARNL